MRSETKAKNHSKIGQLKGEKDESEVSEISDSEESKLQGDYLTANFKSHGTACILGAFIGDAVGAYVEFQQTVTIQEVENAMKMYGGGTFNGAPGMITDDSEMALCIFNGLQLLFSLKFSDTNTNTKVFNLDQIASYFHRWAYSNPQDNFKIIYLQDIGFATRAALWVGKPKGKNELVSQTIFKQVLENNRDTQSNGCLMRITPMAVWCSQLDNDSLFKIVEMCSYLTHCNEIPINCCYLYCLAVKLILKFFRDRSQSDDDNNVQLIQDAQNLRVSIFETLLDEAKTRKMGTVHDWLNEIKQGNYPNPQDKIGWIKIAFLYSLYYLTNQNPII